MERGLSTTRREMGRLFDRIQLRVRAWQEALDPSTHSWAEASRRPPLGRDPEAAREELVRKIDKARSAG